MEVNLYENLSINSDFWVQKPKGMLLTTQYLFAIQFWFLEFLNRFVQDWLDII